MNSNGRIDSFDVQQLSRLASRLPVSGVAALPSPAPTTTDTDRLTAEEPPTSELAKTDSAPRSDVDGTGTVDVQDVAWAIYYFNRSANGVAPTEAKGKKLDLNGDQLFDAADVLLAVTDLNTQSASAEGEGTSSTTTDGKSEEDLNSLTSLLAEDLVASRKKKQPSSPGSSRRNHGPNSLFRPLRKPASVRHAALNLVRPMPPTLHRGWRIVRTNFANGVASEAAPVGRRRGRLVHLFFPAEEVRGPAQFGRAASAASDCLPGVWARPAVPRGTRIR